MILWDICDFFYLFQKDGIKRIRMVYNSNRPAIISRDRSSFAGVPVKAKLPEGPSSASPGPTLLIAVMEAESAVSGDILLIKGRISATANRTPA